jgi:hypothetical protein
MPSQRFRRFLLSLAPCFLAALCLPLAAQNTQPPAQSDFPVLRVTTREVVLDVVARDQHNNPVANLTASDLQVFERGNGIEVKPKRIRSIRVIDPRHDASRAGATDSGFRISSGAVCALNSTTHYEIAIEASDEPGFHQVQVNTTRKKVTLSFRHRYYVGATAGDSHPEDRKPDDGTRALREAACFHSLTPPTLSITAHPMASAGEKSARYSVTVRPESLAGIGLDGTNNRVQLDFGMCTFDATGALVQYLRSSVDRVLTGADLDRVQSRGLVNQLQIPSDPPPLARFAVRDRVTGNLGVVDVALPVSLSAQAGSAAALPRPHGSILSFGVVTPREGTFCGDVYELPAGTSALPDFWSLEPVGSVYTDALTVPNQDITIAGGIPGVTRNNTWFGVDYYGEFYIKKAGRYEFELQSDDGSRLEIDNQPVIDLDGVHQDIAKTGHVHLGEGLHTIHVPYFQGPPISLALVLRIKPPGQPMEPFNITEFAAPAARP